MSKVRAAAMRPTAAAAPTLAARCSSGVPAEAPDPPLDAWAQDELYRELMRIARGLDDPDGAEALIRRLERPTAEHRAEVERAMDELASP